MEGMSWDKLRLEHVGIDADDATNLKDEIDLRIAQAAELVADMKHADTATVSVTIKVKRTGTGGGTLVQGEVALKPPRRLRLGVGGLYAGGELVTQSGRQLDVQDVLRAARETAAEAEQIERPARRRPEPAWRRQAAIESAESAEGGEG